MAVSVLMIAGIFFLVTTALAVGPLLLCRVFVRPRQECRPPAGTSSFVQGFLSMCGLAVGLAVAVLVTYFTLMTNRSGREPLEPPAPTAERHDVSPAEEDAVEPFAATTQQSSLFDPVSPATEAVPAPVVPAHTGFAWLLLPVTLILCVIALANDRFRAGLMRAVPVVLAAGLLGVLVFGRMLHDRPRPPSMPPSTDRHSHVTAPAPLRGPEPPAIDVAPVAVPPGKQHEDVLTEQSEGESASVEPDKSGEHAHAVTTYVGTTSDGAARDELPDWTRNASVGSIRVIGSGKHATVTRAEVYALAELRTLLHDELVRQHPEARGWPPPDEVVLHSEAILKRAVERTQIQVGDNAIPMYEAYWQVDPTIGAVPLENAWRPSVVKQRLAWLGGGIGLLTLLLGSLAAGLRVDEQTGGKRRKALTLGTLAVWAVVGGAVLLVA